MKFQVYTLTEQTPDDITILTQNISTERKLCKPQIPMMIVSMKTLIAI